jgi:very-short-patch-repair endonuclease
MTPEEAMLWERLRANRLQGFHFRRQQVIAGFIVDFYCHSTGLVIEVDGSVHDQRVEYDLDRSRILEGFGLRVLRFKNQEIREDIDAVLARVVAACQAFPPI